MARTGWLLGLLLIAACALAAPASADTSRYSLAGDCFALRSDAENRFVKKQGDGYEASASSLGGAERYRMQATALGKYLLYDAGKEFLAVDVANQVVSAGEPSNRADWTVQKQGDGFTLLNRDSGRSLAVAGSGELVASQSGERFEFVEASGCPKYPEIKVNADGAPTTGPVEYGEVSGLIDAHMHHMAFEFLGGRAHCGRPWHRFGAPSALQDCPDHEPNGAGAVLENTVSYGNPGGTHDTDGWPSFEGWPHHASLTHEQSYYKWLERSWRGGLRVFVNLLVENEVLCELYPLKKNSCNEMDSARLQARRMHELEEYIDAQEGGPGKGWFRIVRDPFEAREVINDGKLAVIMGMETSKPFNCGRFNGSPTCSEAQMEAQIEQFHDIGVRQLELVNKFDNAFTGVAGDSGQTGTITNTGNFYDTGRFWDLETCSDARYSDRSPAAVHYHNDDQLIANGLDALLEPLPPGSLPIYPAKPHCNTLNLSSRGRQALREVMDREMIFDPDHMGVYARQDALEVLENERYPGVVSSHSWSTADAYPRIYGLGGVITPYAGSSEDFVEQWRQVRRDRDELGLQYYGFGYGADMNGFGSQGGPRGEPNPVEYPFESFDGKVTLDQQRSGSRTYDINEDGVAHYGLYPDWIEDLRMIAGDKIIREMGRGAEAYLQMWERTVGVERVRCRDWPDLTSGGLGSRLNLGDRPKPLLLEAGQPVERTRAWKWCAETNEGDREKKGVSGVFTGQERIGLALTKMPDHEAGGVGPGDSKSKLRNRAERLGGGLWVRTAGSGARYVYVVDDGEVEYVGVGTNSVTGGEQVLERYVDLAGV